MGGACSRRDHRQRDSSQSTDSAHSARGNTESVKRVNYGDKHITGGDCVQSNRDNCNEREGVEATGMRYTQRSNGVNGVNNDAMVRSPPSSSRSSQFKSTSRDETSLFVEMNSQSNAQWSASVTSDRLNLTGSSGEGEDHSDAHHTSPYSTSEARLRSCPPKHQDCDSVSLGASRDEVDNLHTHTASHTPTHTHSKSEGHGGTSDSTSPPSSPLPPAAPPPHSSPSSRSTNDDHQLPSESRGDRQTLTPHMGLKLHQFVTRNIHAIRQHDTQRRRLSEEPHLERVDGEWTEVKTAAVVERPCERAALVNADKGEGETEDGKDDEGDDDGGERVVEKVRRLSRREAELVDAMDVFEPDERIVRTEEFDELLKHLSDMETVETTTVPRAEQ